MSLRRPGPQRLWVSVVVRDQPSSSRMARALASMRFSPADRPRLASCSTRSLTTWMTWPRSRDSSFSRLALYRRDQLLSPPPSTLAHHPISHPPSRLPHRQEPGLVLRMTASGAASHLDPAAPLPLPMLW